MKVVHSILKARADKARRDSSRIGGMVPMAQKVGITLILGTFRHHSLALEGLSNEEAMKVLACAVMAKIDLYLREKEGLTIPTGTNLHFYGLLDGDIPRLLTKVTCVQGDAGSVHRCKLYTVDPLSLIPEEISKDAVITRETGKTLLITLPMLNICRL